MPYRSETSRREPPPDEMKKAARWDDRILAFVMIVLGGLRGVIGLASHETFGAEATIATIVAVLGVLLLLSTRHDSDR
jgi:hypothetical protein